jgi:class 3 adenylate cyclase
MSGNGPAEWEAAGLYDPTAPDADEFVELLRYLADKGATLDDLIESRANQALSAAASDRLMRPQRTVTVAEAAERFGLTVEQIERSWLSLGLPPVTTDEPAIAERDLPLIAMFKVGVELLGFEGTLQFTRVMGSSLARIADAAISTFLINVEGPLVEEHKPPVELARASYEATEILAALPAIFEPIFLQHAAMATMRTRTTRDQARGYAEFRLSVGFVDLVDYTRWSSDLSVTELALAVNEFEEAASDLVTRHGARVVKTIGDAVMYVGADVPDVCAIALDLADFVDAHPTLTRLRGAVAAGSLMSRDGDYFGPTVNLAARAVKVADPGEVVADRPVEGFTARPLGPHTFRGFDEPVELFAISR